MTLSINNNIDQGIAYKRILYLPDVFSNEFRIEFNVSFHHRHNVVFFTQTEVENDFLLNFTVGPLSLSSPSAVTFGPGYHFKLDFLNKDEICVFSFIGLWCSFKEFKKICNLSELKRTHCMVSPCVGEQALVPSHLTAVLSVGSLSTLSRRERERASSCRLTDVTVLESFRSLFDEDVFADPSIEIRHILALKESGLRVLRSSINVGNAANFMQVAQKHDDQELKKIAVNFIVKHFKEVKSTCGWRNLPDSTAKYLLSTFLDTLNEEKK